MITQRNELLAKRKVLLWFAQKTKQKILKVKKLPAYLTEEEFARVMKHVKMPKHRLANNLAFNSGLRISEIVNLKPENIDIKSKRIFIKDAKGGKDRVVPLPKSFPEKYIKLLPLKFKNLKSGVRSLEIAFKRAIKISGIAKPEVHFHSLRHSFSVCCMEKGIPLNSIQILLGHESIATTSIYLKINPKEALEKYEELW